MLPDVHAAWLVRQEQNKDQVREAERYRLARQTIEKETNSGSRKKAVPLPSRSGDRRSLRWTGKVSEY